MEAQEYLKNKEYLRSKDKAENDMVCDNPVGLLASRQRVWPFGRVG